MSLADAPLLPLTARYRVAGLIAGVTVLRLVLATAMPLLPQEAYYWTWSLHLDLSYFDHPPLVAWAIALATDVFGQTSFGIKAAAVAWSIGWNVLWALLVDELYGDERITQWSLVALNATLIYEALGVGPTPDGPLLFGWIGAIWSLARLRSTRAHLWWLAFGAFTGIACLGKYTGWLLPAVALMWLLLASDQRHWLRRPWPYAAIALAALVFSPVLYWNLQHGWASFEFQTVRRAADASGIKPRYVLAMLGVQALVVTPYLFFIALREGARVANERRRRPGNSASLLLLSSGAVPIAVCAAASLFVDIRLQWLAPAWWAWIVLAVARRAREPAAQGRLRIGLASSVGVTAVGLGALLVPDLPLPGNLNSWSGWRAAAMQVDLEEAKARAAGERTFVFSPNYKASSLIWFHRAQQRRTYAQDVLGERALQYDHFPRRRDLIGATGLLVLPDPGSSRDALDRARRHFAFVERVAELRTPADGPAVRSIEIWRCRGYRGPSAGEAGS